VIVWSPDPPSPWAVIGPVLFVVTFSTAQAIVPIDFCQSEAVYLLPARATSSLTPQRATDSLTAVRRTGSCCDDCD
jgi:hypothetical protein